MSMQNDVYIVGSTKLRNRVGQMLDDALQGHTTIIERHGRRVARVVPYREFDRLAERLARLEALAASTLGEDWEEKLPLVLEGKLKQAKQPKRRASETRRAS